MVKSHNRTEVYWCEITLLTRVTGQLVKQRFSCFLSRNQSKQIWGYYFHNFQALFLVCVCSDPFHVYYESQVSGLYYILICFEMVTSLFQFLSLTTHSGSVRFLSLIAFGLCFSESHWETWAVLCSVCGLGSIKNTIDQRSHSYKQH